MAKCKVVEKLFARSLVIQTENGFRHRRNRVHIRPNRSRIAQSGDVDIYDYVPPTATFPNTENAAIAIRPTHRDLQTCSPSNHSRRIRRQPV